MIPVMWDLVLCLLPSLVLLLTALLFRWPPVRACTGQLVRRAGRLLWAWLCWFLELTLVPDGRMDSEGPQLVCKPTALAQFLLRHCGSLARPSLASWPWGDPNIQTLWSLAGPLGAGGGIRFARDYLQVKDGGVVALDWAVGPREEAEPWRLGGAKQEQGAGGGVGRGRALSCHTSCPPILILIPNSWGRVTPHLLRLCALALRQGYYPVVFHRRGQGGCPLVTPRFQEFGDPSDLVQAVAYLRYRYQSSALLAVSEGSGSGLLLSYLGECGSSSYLMAAACLSPVLQGQLWFETPLRPLYRWGVLLYQKLQLSRYASALSAVMDVERLLTCSSQRELEAAMFCSGGGSRVAGQSGGREEVAWGDYWERNEPLRDADEVAVPVLCVRSRDDPLLPPASALPTQLFRNSPYFLLALTARGGHCGFASRDGDGGAPCWSHEVALEYFRAVAEFLRAEERKASGTRGAAARGSPAPQWRTGAAATARKRRATVLRRARPPARPLVCFTVGSEGRGDGGSSGEEQDMFTWHRSYTR
ncbi:protein ABHD15 [Anguilla anguilla]|uniref:protein ABHD15 n=1 Tax=Anguilla anguilla TaxID=7936 RepID=UPI0015A79AB0|nr:protein ABHD15 [Anguilla anguilla]